MTERYPEQKALLAIDEVGSYATLVENADGKSQTDRVLEARIREALGPAKCGTANQVNANQPVKPGEQGPTADEEKARIALGVKECRLDSKGKPLDRAASLDCNESRLSTLAAVNTDDRAAKREAQSKVDGVVKQIQKDLRLEMKDAFLNGNADDARDLLDAATEAINDAGSTLDLSQAQIDRLVKPMSNTYVAMKMGEETLQASDQLRTKYDQISQNAMTARLNMDQAQQSGDAYAGRVALQQYQYALNDNLRLNSEFNTMVAPRFSTLQGYQRMNWLDASDFRDFTKGYTSLQNDIATLARGGNSASQLPTSTMSAPSDLSSIRSGYADQFRTNYGVQIPTMPTSLFTSMTSQPNLGTIGGLGRRSN